MQQTIVNPAGGIEQVPPITTEKWNRISKAAKVKIISLVLLDLFRQKIEEIKLLFTA